MARFQNYFTEMFLLRTFTNFAQMVLFYKANWPMELKIEKKSFKQHLLGWLGGAKVSCILRHRGVQLILAYSWARPAILVAGKGRWGIFLFLLFLHFHSCSFLPCPSLSSLLLSLLSVFSLSLGDDTK